MSEAPFCASSPEAAAMDDGEFWDNVASSIMSDPYPHDPSHEAIDAFLHGDPCEECGAVGACGWDSEGRPLIHALGEGERT